MNDLEKFEQELASLKPSLPPEFRNRLQNVRRLVAPPAQPEPAENSGFLSAGWWLRWLVPAAGLAALVLLVAHAVWRMPATDASLFVQADMVHGQVQVQSELVSTFESVVRLSGGEPVRLRYAAYVDDITLTDPQSGVTWQQRAPRVEVIPVGFDTY